MRLPQESFAAEIVFLYFCITVFILAIEINCRFEIRHRGICGYTKLLPSAVIKCNQYNGSTRNGFILS